MAKWIRFKRHNSPLIEFGKLLEGDSVEQGQVTLYKGDMFDGAEPTDELWDVNELELLTPCWPSKMIGLWNNVRSTAEKKGLAIPPKPLYFLKSSNCYLAHRGEIQRPAYFEERIIFEAELGVVIGRNCRNVSEADAGDFIFGYTCVNDITAPTIIGEDPTFGQWCRSKSMDTFGAFGPSISTEVDVDQLVIQARYRDKIRQDYPASELIFSPVQLVSFLSQDMTLFPGDLIACGTAEGALPLKPGSTVEIHIEGLDTLINTMSS